MTILKSFMKPLLNCTFSAVADTDAFIILYFLVSDTCDLHTFELLKSRHFVSIVNHSDVKLLYIDHTGGIVEILCGVWVILVITFIVLTIATLTDYRI